MLFKRLRIFSAVLIVLALLLSASAYAAGEIVYTNTRWLADNLEYLNSVSWDSTAERRFESYSIRMTGTGDAYPIVMNGDTIYGGFTISEMAEYAESLGKNLLAVVNSDFFADYAVPIGIVVEDGIYKSSANGRNAVVFGYDGSVSIIEPPTVWITISYDGGEGESGEVGDTGETGAVGGAGDSGVGGIGVGADGIGGAPGSSEAVDAGGAAGFGSAGGIGDATGAGSTPGVAAAASTGSVPGAEGAVGAVGADETESSSYSVRFRTLNKVRGDFGGMCLHTDVFSTVSTRTKSEGWFVKFKVLEGELTVSGSMKLEVVETLTGDGAIPIGEGYMVLSASDLSNLSSEYEKFTVGDIVTLTTTCNDERLVNAAYATGGGDVLVSDGAIADPNSWTQTLRQRAPRTAFGVLADGTVVSYVVDGRYTEHSVGMTLDELAAEMKRQGCVYAVNFDGGGSSALSVRIPGDDSVSLVNRVSDGAERICSTYLLFVTDIESDGIASNLSLKNDGVIVLAESSVDLSFVATDAGYMPADVPDDIVVTPLSKGASVDGTRYTAGMVAGPEKVSLYSPTTEAYGVGEIYVITRPTSITATMKGSSAQLSSIRIAPGATLELGIKATYYRRDVISQELSYTYTISGDIGEMMEPGVFVAGLNMGQIGKITISAGGRSTTVQVEVSEFADMENHWAKEYVGYLMQAGIVNGISETEYGPSLPMKRCDYILMLYRAAGLPDIRTVFGFDDVPWDAYYAKAMIWARENGIAFGDGENNFYPQMPLTRQDAFTFTYRTLGLLGIEFVDGTNDDLELFPDAAELDDYAAGPTATLVSLGVIEGMNGLLIPMRTLTRAEMAKVLAVVLSLGE
ncbi:MAG: phosphodiester glycosidase family protein [Oscillospiraceae bacterium]|nr:phosphodiester glycosidase family protein [Oscillospiraceae bacterium]